MYNLQLSRTVIHILVVAWILLLFMLVGFQALPVFSSNDAQYIDQAGLQRTRSQFFAKAALILAYRPDTEKVQAISDLQAAYPLFQQEQAVLLANSQPDVQLTLQTAKPDYLTIVAVVKAVLANSNQTIEPAQVDLILLHSRAYVIAMNNVITILQQHADTQTLQLFTIEIVIEALLLTSTLSIMLLGRTRLAIQASRKPDDNTPVDHKEVDQVRSSTTNKV